ncbi:MAG TPA: hypothetical protein VFS67_11020 [Polyangiaceae bacterium]|nr:hypothetical protein [Polyangiaceae bacterium]
MTTVEYVILLVLIAAIGIGAWRTFGRRVILITDSGTRRLDALTQNESLDGSAPGGPQDAKASASRGCQGGPTPAPAPSPTPSPSPTPTPAPSVFDPAALPATGSAAPKTMTYPPVVIQAMKTSYANSFPGGKSQERGGTIVRGADGQIRVVNEGTGTGGTFTPNRNVGPTDQLVGTYHTHPYDQSEGGHLGVTFSGADIANSATMKEPKLVDAGSKQFLLTPTQATTGTSAAIKSDWNAEYAKQLKAGASIQDASGAATRAVAKKYNMAYYEGTNGTFTRVVP